VPGCAGLYGVGCGSTAGVGDLGGSGGWFILCCLRQGIEQLCTRVSALLFLY